jgi:hypothetical protein
VKDAEFIYSLYVQANPVPDPDLLPLTRDEAALLSFERSPDMMNQEETDNVQQGTPVRRSRLVAAIGAAAVLVAALAVVVLWAGRDTAPVAAAEAEPVMSFDGSVCSYEGPTLIEEGTITFALTNAANRTAELGYVRLEEAELAEELELIPVGSDAAVASPIPPGYARFVEMAPGESVMRDYLMRPGFHVLDCATGDPVVDHVWRAAQIEVVAP